MRAVISVVACLAATATARAEADVPASEIPPECIAYVSADGSEEALWGQVLSLAACVQDATVASITTSEQLRPTLESLAQALGPSTMLYVYAVENGPESVQLRATYQIGMAFVGLAIRARASIRFPPLRAELEPLLEPVTRTARIAFTLIDRAVRNDPTLESDVVASYMIRDARLKLAQLGGTFEPQWLERIATFH